MDVKCIRCIRNVFTVRIAELTLENYRCLESLTIEPDTGLIVLAGENGSGKSSVFDAMNTLFRQSGRQTGFDAPDATSVTRRGTDEGRIEARFQLSDREEDIVGSSDIHAECRFQAGAGYEYITGNTEISRLLQERESSEGDVASHTELTRRRDVPGVLLHRSPYRVENPPRIENPDEDVIHPQQERQRRGSRSTEVDTRAGIIVNLLLSEDRRLKDEVVTRLEDGESREDALAYMEEEQESYLEDFNELLAPKEYAGIEEGGPGEPPRFTVEDPESGKIDFRELSSGEREVLFLFADIRRLRPEHYIIAIDEPELHLHHDLQRRLVSRLLELSRDNQVWLTTHSIPIIRAAMEADGAQVYYLRNASGSTGNQALQVEGRETIRELYASIAEDISHLLVGEKLVFVEGGDLNIEDARADSHIYNKMFPHVPFTFVPGGNRDAVEGSLWIARQWIGEHLPSGIFVLRDRDDLDEETVREKEAEDPNLFYLPRRNMESFLLNPEAIWHAVEGTDAASDLGIDSRGALEERMESEIDDLDRRTDDPTIDYRDSLESFLALFTDDVHDLKVELAEEMHERDLVPDSLAEIVQMIDEADP